MASKNLVEEPVKHFLDFRDTIGVCNDTAVTVEAIVILKYLIFNSNQLTLAVIP